MQILQSQQAAACFGIARKIRGGVGGEAAGPAVTGWNPPFGVSFWRSFGFTLEGKALLFEGFRISMT